MGNKTYNEIQSYISEIVGKEHYRSINYFYSEEKCELTNTFLIKDHLNAKGSYADVVNNVCEKYHARFKYIEIKLVDISTMRVTITFENMFIAMKKGE